MERYLSLSLSPFVLVGKMVMELGDNCSIRCLENDLTCELDFKTKVIKEKKKKEGRGKSGTIHEICAFNLFID